MRTLLLLGLVLGSIACAKAQSTAPGRLGGVQKAPLPEGISRGADDSPQEHERSAEVCRGEHSPGAQVKVKWESFGRKEDHFLTSYDVELTKPQDGVGVRLADPQPVTNANKADKDPYVGTVTIVMMCTIEGTETSSKIQIRADGKPASPPK